MVKSGAGSIIFCRMGICVKMAGMGPVGCVSVHLITSIGVGTICRGGMLTGVSGFLVRIVVLSHKIDRRNNRQQEGRNQVKKSRQTS